MKAEHILEIETNIGGQLKRLALVGRVECDQWVSDRGIKGVRFVQHNQGKDTFTFIPYSVIRGAANLNNVREKVQCGGD